MGLDVFLRTDNEEALWGPEPDWEEVSRYSLSRPFCNLLHRRSVVSHAPELDQLGQLVGVDVEPLYEMMTYPDAEEIEWRLEEAESEEERQQVLVEAEAEKAQRQGNLDRVQATVDGLLSGLARYDDLPRRLDAGRRDTLDNARYFADFLHDTTGSLDHRTFGQDLRTVQRYLAFARSRGSHTVYFDFG